MFGEAVEWWNAWHKTSEDEKRNNGTIVRDYPQVETLTLRRTECTFTRAALRVHVSGGATKRVAATRPAERCVFHVTPGQHGAARHVFHEGLGYAKKKGLRVATQRPLVPTSEPFTVEETNFSGRRAHAGVLSAGTFLAAVAGASRRRQRRGDSSVCDRERPREH